MKTFSRLFLLLTALLLTVSSVEAGIRCPLPMLDELFKSIRSEDRGPFDKRNIAKPQEGSSKKFWLWDFSIMPPGFRQVEAKCLAVTEHAYIFVETTVIEEVFPEGTVDAIVQALEHSCPAFDERGILDVDCDIFGQPPDALDNDPKVYFLYADFAQYGHMAFDGYFNAFDQMPDEIAWQNYRQHSNEVEILYLNAKAPASDYMLSVLSHEFQHLIHYRYDQLEESWINEAMSEAAMTACGYFTDKAHLARYCAHPQIPLVDVEHPSYGAVLLFGAYLLEQFGEESLGRLVACPETGIAGLEAAFPQLPFTDLFHRWACANGCASLMGIDEGLWGYESFPLPKLKTLALGYETSVLTLPASGLAYLPLREEAHTLTITDVSPAAPSSHASSRLLRRQVLFNGMTPTLYLVMQGDDGLQVTPLTPEDKVYSIPGGEGFVLLSTLEMGGGSFSLTLSR